MFPQSFKTSYITPILKNSTAAIPVFTALYPTYQLSLNCWILVRIIKHLDNNKLLPINQSAYRHSTETAVLKVFSDVLETADQGRLTLLVLLDLSAAFDTVDHDILQIAVFLWLRRTCTQLAPVLSQRTRMPDQDL